MWITCCMRGELVNDACAIGGGLFVQPNLAERISFFFFSLSFPAGLWSAVTSVGARADGCDVSWIHGCGPIVIIL